MEKAGFIVRLAFFASGDGKTPREFENHSLTLLSNYSRGKTIHLLFTLIIISAKVSKNN